ncbi:Cas9 inhibitor AcrIIA9 family protein [Flavobacterium sp. DG2-3]|uniref:Cas9 inhibitor AcrIIA9 family protein n=1 Tax=Flavobacterium sp. DG2-3 TaxID=3068317 RepID=UPI00273DDCE1|nr:Cas9 inhibitor AcrIIA9 family protein [Flavobacterium sp. DG2-3]MDP5200350.1 Cas9 inhibitor AcrIIA9 family protein [Flavobacterium sp. DG2-3]
MKASENFRKAIENYLNSLAQGDSAFAPHYAKASKNFESCLHYIGGQVKKTGLCYFDNQEIFDMAVKYYTDDSIPTPAPVAYKAVVQTPAAADLFSQPEIPAAKIQTQTVIPVKKDVKPAAQTALTLFDL